MNTNHTPAAECSSSRDKLDAALRIGMIVSSAILVLLGVAIAAIGTLPSPIPSFFLIAGAHTSVAGAAGFIQRFTRGSGPLHRITRFASGLLSAALIGRIAWLIVKGTIVGPMTIIAPLLLGLPALLNLSAAVIGIGRPIPPPGTCPRCGYDLRNIDASCCPECGAEITPQQP